MLASSGTSLAPLVASSSLASVRVSTYTCASKPPPSSTRTLASICCTVHTSTICVQTMNSDATTPKIEIAALSTGVATTSTFPSMSPKSPFASRAMISCPVGLESKSTLVAGHMSSARARSHICSAIRLLSQKSSTGPGSRRARTHARASRATKFSWSAYMVTRRTRAGERCQYSEKRPAERSASWTSALPAFALIITVLSLCSTHLSSAS